MVNLEEFLINLEFTKLIIFLFVITLLHFILIKVYKKLKLLDLPNIRKKHSIPIPYSGGAILLSTLYISIFLFDYSYRLNFLIIISSIVFFTGFLDDLGKITIFNRILLQCVSCVLLFYYGIKVTDIGYFESIDKIISFGSFSILFSIFCIMITINAFNFFDGIDGNLVSITSTSIFFFFLFSNNLSNSYFLITVLLFSLIFIFFNFGLISGYKNFLGDSGSNLLGFIYAGLMIDSAGTTFRSIEPTLIIWLIPIIYFDFLHLIIFRLKNSKSPYLPDENHIHHILSKFFNKKLVVLIITITNIFFSLIGYVIYKVFNAEGSILFFILMFITYYFIKSKIMKKEIFA